MSLNITNSESANLTIGLDSFRSMVNYESGKNKGYVRLTRNSDGQLVLNKFNNKVDVKLSWRSNTGATESMVLRQAFLRALKGGMPEVASTGKYSAYETLRRMLMGEDGELATKPLSRREIRNVLSKYDQLVSTPDQRKSHVRQTLSRIFNQAQAAGFQGDEREFLSSCMKLEGGFMNERFEPYYQVKQMDQAWTTKEADKPELDGFNSMKHDVKGAKKSVPMEKDELSFLQELSYLETIGQGKVKLLKLQHQLKNHISAAMDPKAIVSTDPKDPFAGSGLSREIADGIAGSLMNLLKDEGVDPFLGMDDGPGSKGKVMELFKEKVLPAMFRQAREQQALLGKDSPAQDTLMTMDEIVNTAKAFFSEAKALKELIARGDQPVNGDDQLVSTLKNWMASTADNICDTQFFLEMRPKFVLNSGISNKEGTSSGIFAGLIKAFSDLKGDAKLEQLTAAFIAKRYPAVNQEGVMKPKTQQEMGAQLIDKALIAAKLNYGERWSVDGKSLLQGSKADEFISEAGDEMVRVVNTYGRGDIDDLQEMYATLAGARLMKIVNQRIKNHLGHATEQRLHMDSRTDVSALVPGFEAAAKLYNLFNAKAKALAQKAIDAYDKMLLKEVKNGKISIDQAQAICNEVLHGTMVSLVKAERGRFLEALKADNLTRDEIKDFVKGNTASMEKHIQGAISEALDIANQRIAAYGNAKNKLRQNDCATLLDGLMVAKYVTQSKDAYVEQLRPALERTYNQVLKDRLDAIKTDTKAGTLSKEDSAKVVADVQKKFTEAADKLVRRMHGLRDEAVKYTKEVAVTGLESQFKNDPAYASYAQLKSADRKALIGQLADEIVSRLQDRIDAALEDAFRHPDNYRKRGDITKMVTAEVLDSIDSGSIGNEVKDVFAERTNAVQSWLGKTDEEKKTLMDGCQLNAIAHLDPKHVQSFPSEALTPLLSRARNRVAQRILDMPILYAGALTKENFEAMVAKEIAAEAKESVAQFAKAYQGFLKNADKLAEPYLALGRDSIELRQKTMAREVAKSTELKNINDKAMGALFTKLLQMNLDQTVKDIQLDFDAFVAKIDQAMEKVELSKAKFRESFLENAKDLPQGVLDHFTDVIEAKFAERQYAKACIDPDSFINDSYDVYLDEAEVHGRMMAEEVSKANYSVPANYRAIIKTSGFLLKNVGESTLQLMERNLATFFGSAKLKEGLVGYLNSVLDTDYLSSVDKLDYRDIPEPLRQRYESVSDSVVMICTPLVGELRIAELCKPENVKFAEGVFKDWLNGYRKTYPFPDIKFEGKTIEEHAVELFFTNIKSLQERMVNDPKFDADIVNQEFLVELSSLFGRMGTRLALQEFIHNRTAEILQNEFKNNASLYGSDEDLAAETKDLLYSNLVKAIEFNRETFYERVNTAVKQTEEKVEGLQITSYEGYARCQEQVEKIFNDNFNHVTNSNADFFNRALQIVPVERELVAYRRNHLRSFNDFFRTFKLSLQLPEFNAIYPRGYDQQKFLADFERHFVERLDQCENEIRKLCKGHDFDSVKSLMENYAKNGYKSFISDLSNIKGDSAFIKCYKNYQKKDKGAVEMLNDNPGFGDMF